MATDSSPRPRKVPLMAVPAGIKWRNAGILI